MLDSRRSRFFLIVFSAIFATVFLVVYNPLDVSSFFINTSIGNLVSIKSAGVIGALVIGLTQLVFRPILGIKSFSKGGFVIWLLIEFVLLSAVMYFFYGERGRPFWDEMIVVSRMTFTLAAVPYLFACLLIALFRPSDNSNEGDKNEFSGNNDQRVNLLTLRDQNGKVMLTLKTEDLVYLKAEDNYIQVAYVHNNLIRKKLIRNSLKSAENELQSKEFLRIHRSYLINLRNIDNVKRDRSRLQVQMTHVPDELFPVSSSYQDTLESAISDLS